jgi:hypothetical protein
MKIALSLAFVVASASAFVPHQPAFASSKYNEMFAVLLYSLIKSLLTRPDLRFFPFLATSSALFAEQSRQQFLAQSAAAAFATLAVSAQPAYAAKYGGFGAGSPEVLDPTRADIDQGILKGGDVQQAITDIKGFQSKVRNMQASLQSDPQVNIKSTLIKEFDFAKLRSTFNTYNKPFEEDTQRGTDRLIRVILQDITELDLAATLKSGIPRSDKRVTVMTGKLSKLDQAFDDLLAFVK